MIVAVNLVETRPAEDEGIRNLFAVVVLSGIYSFLMATVMVALDAVDVAMTEASVGAGISTVLLLAALVGAVVMARKVSRRFLREGIQTIAFVRTRLAAELILRGCRDRLGGTSAPLAGAVQAYRGGYLPEERREIGILKAIGWETSDVILMKLWEGMIVSLSSFLLAVILAYLHVFFFSARVFAPVLKGWAVLYPEFKLVPFVDASQVVALPAAADRGRSRCPDGKHRRRCGTGRGNHRRRRPGR